MTFFRIDNIDLWLSAGVIFNILWVIYKAFQYDDEKCNERIRKLENNEVDIYRKLRRKGGLK